MLAMVSVVPHYHTKITILKKHLIHIIYDPANQIPRPYSTKMFAQAGEDFC